MLKLRYKQIVVTATVITLSGLFVLTGCQSDEPVIPVYHAVGAPPVEVTIEQLLSDYTSDEVAADIKYKGKRLLFSDVEVESLTIIFIDSANDPILYIVNSDIEFRPKYDIDTTFVREGFVVDMIGEVYGWFGLVDRYLVVENCWVKIIEGDAGSVLDLEEIY
ncbi:hypothetical protein ACFLYB_02275 [Chloroflexota bacterium]